MTATPPLPSTGGSLTVIPDRAFYNAKAVKTVKLSDNVTSIGERRLL